MSGPRPHPKATPLAVIRLDAIEKTYEGPALVKALRPTSLVVWPEDYVAIMGRSGSGKSTLLNILGLLDNPSSGRYLLNGTDVSSLSERARNDARADDIGFVFQFFHLLPQRSVLENVALGLIYGSRLKKTRRLENCLAYLERVGLAHRRHALASTLSGGERQRVAVARALVSQPRMLLCDEPTGNLDSETSVQILDLIDDLQRDDSFLVVMATHDPEIARRARHVVRIRDGSLDEDASRPNATI
jgi:putative ABC transport system ATP-binding protein